jgi:hypothetical protein
MQRHRVRAVLGIAFSFLSAVSLLGQGAQQTQIRVEFLYPHYAARGQATVINVAVPSPDRVQGAEISPSTGVTVSGIKGSGSGSEQNVGWWEVTLDVAKDAASGDRSLVLMLPRGRTLPVTISVVTHAPAISNLRIAPSPSNQSSAELQLTAADAAGDLGDSPYLWFSAACGGDPIVGALRGRVSGGMVRAALPNVRRAAKDGIPAVGKCDLQVRLTDSTGIESNTLTTTVDFTN